MAEPRTLLLLCILVLCLTGSGFIRGQTVSGSQGQGIGRVRDNLCRDVLWGRGGDIKAAGTCLSSLGAQVSRLLSLLPRLKSVAVLPEA